MEQHVASNRLELASAAIALQISAALPVWEPYRNRTRVVVEGAIPSGSSAEGSGSSPPPRVSATALSSGAHSASHHGSTASSRPTASFASPRATMRSAPRNASAESSVCAAWLQSFAVVVWRSRRRLVSPSPRTAYRRGAAERNDRSPALRLRL